MKNLTTALRVNCDRQVAKRDAEGTLFGRVSNNLHAFGLQGASRFVTTVLESFLNGVEDCELCLRTQGKAEQGSALLVLSSDFSSSAQ